MIALAWSSKKSQGNPNGGSLNFTRLFEKRYQELGGQIKYNSKVTKVTVENNSATGIMLENGDTHNADTVISAADGYYTIYEMLEGNYVNKQIDSYYKTRDSILTPFPSLVYISLGISRVFKKEAHAQIIQLEEPVVIDDSIKHEYINIFIYNFDPTLAEKGKTCMNIMFETFNYEYWVNLRQNDIKKYNEEKTRISNQIIEVLDKKFGDIKSNVEVIDVATPATFIRYTNNWRGSFEGWLPTQKSMTYKIKKVLPGLKNFFMIGQWVEPGGGLPTAILSGRNVAQIICKKDRKRFRGKQ